jgi:hypothetical protein
MLVDPYRAKLEEWVERSRGKLRADVAHDKLVALGYQGAERTTRRAVAAAKRAWRAGNRRVYRPWIPEPGMWMQWDYGVGPMVGGRATWLFCAWLAWSRFRVVLPIFDKALPSVVACLDAALRRFGGYAGDLVKRRFHRAGRAGHRRSSGGRPGPWRRRRRVGARGWA